MWLWIFGSAAEIPVAHPHLVSPRSLRVRHGATVDIEVPWDAVSGVSHRRRDLPSTIRKLQPRETECGTEMQVGVSGEVNVHLSLNRPISVPTATGEVEVRELSFLADDPRELVAQARRLAASGRAGPGTRPG
jgi:hypothetical protein